MSRKMANNKTLVDFATRLESALKAAKNSPMMTMGTAWITEEGWTTNPNTKQQAEYVLSQLNNLEKDEYGSAFLGENSVNFYQNLVNQYKGKTAKKAHFLDILYKK